MNQRIWFTIDHLWFMMNHATDPGDLVAHRADEAAVGPATPRA
jgi:hypothetical protein